MGGPSTTQCSSCSPATIHYTILTLDVESRLDGLRPVRLVRVVHGDAAQRLAVALARRRYLDHGGGRPGARIVRLAGIDLRMERGDFLVACVIQSERKFVISDAD